MTVVSTCLHSIHPRATRWRFWLVIGLLSTVMYGALSTALSHFRIGFSNEAEQSVGSAWTLVRLGRGPVLPGHYAAIAIDNRVGHGFAPGTWFVKKVVGQPGDLVVVATDETMVNGKRVAGPLDIPTPQRNVADPVRTFVLGPGDYFVVGTRPHSLDSRYWGPVKVNQFMGQATLL